MLIDRVNALRRDGDKCPDAVVKGGMLRFRAIILDSLTTFAGLTPMLLESLQARFLIPMAVSLGFGVMFATGITLILIPSGYMILDDIHELIEKVKDIVTGQRSSSD
ncbi:MAG: efflux RND transporter permease subunit [Desulfobacterales bacterium]